MGVIQLPPTPSCPKKPRNGIAMMMPGYSVWTNDMEVLATLMYHQSIAKQVCKGAE